MKKRVPVLLALGMLLAGSGLAKDKTKSPVPAYVLHAQTVAVLIDPEAGVSVDDPQANAAAQRDVEAALLEWGRLRPLTSTQGADLIIVIRRGTGRLAAPTINDPRQNNRAGSVTPFPGGTSVGGQRGRQPGQADSGNIDDSPRSDSPHPQVEVGAGDDSFVVYRGNATGSAQDSGDESVKDAINSVPVWRYMAKDGLRPHEVPAVDEFRKALAAGDKAEAEREAAKKAQKTP
jgi:hypothetical protein